MFFTFWFRWCLTAHSCRNHCKMDSCSYLSGIPSTAIENVSLMDCARSPSSRTFSPIFSLSGFEEKVAFAYPSQRCNKRLLDGLLANRMKNGKQCLFFVPHSLRQVSLYFSLRTLSCQISNGLISRLYHKLRSRLGIPQGCVKKETAGEMGT